MSHRQALSALHFDSRDMFKVGLALTIVEFLILLLLVPLYWPMIQL